jgi:hypothetical protein
MDNIQNYDSYVNMPSPKPIDLTIIIFNTQFHVYLLS